MSRSIAHLILSLFVAASFTVGGMMAIAHDYTVGSLKIDHPWTRGTPPSAKVAGGFMTITNTGSVPDRLIGGTFPLAGRFELHEMSMDGGVMRMRELAQGLEIKPGETVTLKPGSFHVMFMELKEPLKAGEPVKGTLVFEKAGTITVEYMVEAIGSKGSGHGDHGAGHGTGHGDHGAGAKKKP
jgi:copper(I)-binding protein